jgi:hypothetical protein
MGLFRRHLGYVNRGSDPRLDGPLGQLIGRLQRQSLVYTTTPSTPVIHREGEWGQFTIYDPFFFSVFLKRMDGLYWSLRFGWRFDPNVGDGNNPNEPKHDPPGARFLDWILKPRIDHVVGN